ncbi:MAG: LacI family DNA-binding transcriptional regulator [Christensenellales bacterium]
MNKNKKTTIYDVAQLAGVSSTTVSHVINDTRFVSERSKERVYNAIQELNFLPDSSAKNFRKGIKKIIGFIVPDNSNYFFSTIIEKVQEVVSEKGYNIVICNTKDIKEREKDNIKLLSSGIADGIILASSIGNISELENVIPKNFPIVMVDRIVKNSLYDTITITTFQSIYQGTCDMIKMGNRRIGYVDVDSPYLSPAAERLAGYTQALKDNNIVFNKNIVKQMDRNTKNISKYIDSLIIERCNTIVVVNSYLALKIIFFLEWVKKMNTGKDINLVCFDSFNLLNPAKVNIIERPVAELGRQTGYQILKRIEFPESSPVNIVLPSAYNKII